MRNTAGEKVRQIIREDFDLRISMAVVTYIMDKGFDALKQVTEEDIMEIKGNPLMTDEFCQALVRTAVRICKECHQIDEFLPYIVNHLYVPKANMNKVTIFQDEMTSYRWEEFLDELDVEYDDDADEISSVTIMANVVDTVWKCETE
jgi:hypothetical protein